MTRFYDLTGVKFGRLTAISRLLGPEKTKWLCRCECGRETTVIVSQLISGKTRSCGCLRGEHLTAHSKSRTSPEWRLASARRRIEKLSIPEPNSGCWLWTGRLNKQGYGHTAMGEGNTISASRMSYTAFKGPPGDLFVLHSCDTACCVNPDHLTLGTQRKNIRDAFRRGRMRPQGKLAYLRDPSV